jgi:hypothetical protein
MQGLLIVLHKLCKEGKGSKKRIAQNKSDSVFGIQSQLTREKTVRVWPVYNPPPDEEQSERSHSNRIQCHT